MGDRITAKYLLETTYPPGKAAEIIAGEQSSGTFVPVPGETPDLRARAGARVESLLELEEVEEPSLPGAGRPAEGPARTVRCEMTLSWPLANLGPSLPNLVATVAGNLFELKEVSGLRILDLELPEAFAERYPGPGFGVNGTRRLSGVHGRPLIGTIVKPSVGLRAEETAALAGELAEAGIDFIKDDELQADGPSCPFEERVRAVMGVLRQQADRTGRLVMYAFNLTGEVDEMRRRHDLVEAEGGTCVMVSLNSVGLAGLGALRRDCRLPIHAHRNGWGFLSRHPSLGWSYVAWQKLWRVAGVDHMHVNGLRNKFCEADESVMASARECLTAMWPDKPCTVMPVFSSGQSALQVEDTFAGLGSCDLIYAAGGGIMAHPGGVAAGVASLRQAWEAALAGVPLATYARSHRELAEAMQRYAG
jgi:ribulose-bisphosphate carboxylase large chain